LCIADASQFARQILLGLQVPRGLTLRLEMAVYIALVVIVH
jgi:hypothetical protein